MAAEMIERESCKRLCQIFSGEGRSRVETEVILPDYKEEAYRLIRLDTGVCINGKNTYRQGGTLFCEVEGVVTFTLLYRTDRKGERGGLSSFVTQENFSYTFRHAAGGEEGAEEEWFSGMEASAENVSCKLIGPRKFSVRCDVLLVADVKSGREFSYYSPMLPQDVVIQKTSGRLVCPVTCYSEEFSFSETISLPKGYLSIREVCEMHVDLYAGKVRCEAGGVLFCGNATLQCGYVSTEESYVSFSQPIEFEKAIPLALVEEGDFVQVTLSPNFLKATPDINEDGEQKNLLFEIGYTAELRVYRNEAYTLASDAFSTECDLICRKENLSLEEIVGMTDFLCTVRDSLPWEGQNVLRVEGIRATVDFRNSYVEEGAVLLEGRLSFRYLSVGEDGDVVNTETYHDFTVPIQPESGFSVPRDRECRIEICGGVKSLDLDPEGNELRLRLELYGNLALFCRTQVEYVTEMERGEKKVKPVPGILYLYPSGHESLWEICKNYGISPQRLCEENAISGEDALPPVLRIFR